MNTVIKSCAIAAASLLPTFAFAIDSNDIQGCMQKFTQSYFPDSRATFIPPEEPGLMVPLALNKGTHEVAITVTSSKTGKVIASGVCAVNDDSGRAGSVIISESNSQ